MSFQTTPSAVERAVESKTVQEFISHGKDLTYKSFGFPSSSGYAYYSPQWVGFMAEKVIFAFRSHGITTRHSSTDTIVTGLVLSPTIESVIAYLALTRMGHTILLVAPQLGPEALENLAHDANCKVIINAMEGGRNYKSVPMVALDEMLQQEDQVFRPESCVLLHEDEPAVIMHSSGTTGRPKLISRSHRSILELLRNTHSAVHDNNILMGSWMHWLAGYCMMLFAFVKSGSHVSWPSEDYIYPVESIKNMLLETEPQIIACNASFLIPAVETAEGLEVLKRCMVVTNLGGVLPPSTASLLTRYGVRLATGYGMTELPLSLSSVGNAGDPSFWDYLQIGASVAPHLRFRPLCEDEGNNKNGGEMFYELIVLATLPAMDKKWATAPDGSLHTGDIFVKHPTEESYRCLGRLADTIRVTPNSTDVITLRARIYESVIETQCQEFIDAAVLYGDERPRPAILLFVKSSVVAFSNEYILKKVWSVIETEIQMGPLLLLVGPMENTLVVIRDRTVPRTRKGDVIRTQVFLQFSNLIDSVL